MRIAVLPDDVPGAGLGFDARVSLFGSSNVADAGSVGSQVMRETLCALGRTPSARAWDLAALALAVVAADRYVSRAGTSADGWTRQLEVVVAVTDAGLWEGLRPRLESMLGFLTGDLWTLAFVFGGLQPAPPKRASGGRPETCVALLSGGLDSLIGAIDLTASGQRPLFVSNRVKGDCAKQARFAAEVGGDAHVLSLNANARTTGPRPEISQRPRSLAFLAFAVLAATTLDRYRDGEAVDVIVPENGFISVNVPLTPLRAGSLSTRTTHPRFMRTLQDVLDCLGLRARLVNPYRFMTKGEMMLECADQALLERLAPTSMNCGRGGRINRHCGQCLPCLVRRAAILRHTGALTEDRTSPAYKNPDPQNAFRSPAFARYDDVMQCLAAVDYVRRHGARRWIGPALSAADVPDLRAHREVAERGLSEIGTFLHAAGLA